VRLLHRRVPVNLRPPSVIPAVSRRGSVLPCLRRDALRRVRGMKKGVTGSLGCFGAEKTYAEIRRSTNSTAMRRSHTPSSFVCVPVTDIGTLTERRAFRLVFYLHLSQLAHRFSVFHPSLFVIPECRSRESILSCLRRAALRRGLFADAVCCPSDRWYTPSK
jgi:hypothetical protein